MTRAFLFTRMNVLRPQLLILLLKLTSRGERWFPDLTILSCSKKSVMVTLFSIWCADLLIFDWIQREVWDDKGSILQASEVEAEQAKNFSSTFLAWSSTLPMSHLILGSNGHLVKIVLFYIWLAHGNCRHFAERNHHLQWHINFHIVLDRSPFS